MKTQNQNQVREFNFCIDSQEFQNAINEKKFKVRDNEYHCIGGTQSKNGLSIVFKNIDDERDIIVGEGKNLVEVSKNIENQLKKIYNLKENKHFGKIGMLYKK